MSLRAVRKLAPDPIRQAYRRWLTARRRRRSAKMTVEEVFAGIYRDGIWGRAPDGSPFFSGSGSHDQRAAELYVAAITRFARRLGGPPSAVDLGCGDFSIGAKIRPAFEAYHAADIVPELIRFNSEKFAGAGVTFSTLNLIEDEIPHADVILIRQVLQHLSNGQIQRALANVTGRCRYLIVSEHHPSIPGFTENIDKPVGGDTRMDENSGVVIHRPPFKFEYQDLEVLCDAPVSAGVVRTVAYRL